jgi:4-cresol dehydrogenase (hydroxylating)
MRAFEDAVGAQYVFAGEAVPSRYSACTGPLGRRIAAVIRPATVEQIQALVRIATAQAVPLYPISTGNNWGYGSAQPMRDDNVIVDLGRMNRILEIDAELAYAVLEPGVTQRQLYEHLQAQRIPLALNPTGAGPDCSVLGNTLERGFGIGPNGDHFLAQCGMEVVLASGEILRTGFGHYANAKATYLYKWGVGPYMDGIFTQSNYGIVTKMGVWLAPVPQAFEACYFVCHRDDQLGPVIDSLREMLFDGVFRGPVNLLHRNRVLIMLDRYPWRAMGERTPLSETVANELAARKRIGMWNGVGALSGSAAQVRAAKQTIRQRLRGKVDRITFLSSKKLAMLRRFPRALSLAIGMNVPELLKTLENSYGMMRGIPSEVALSLAYWRNRRPPSPTGHPNPSLDGCGLMWFAPIIPMTNRDVALFRSIIEPILTRHGLDTCITLTAVNERCFDCTLPLLYDLDRPGEAARAQQCYGELIEACRAEGYVPYRLGLQSMDGETTRDDVFWRVASVLKQALDPAGILAPGRYAR